MKIKCDLWFLYHAQGEHAKNATYEQWNMACVALDDCFSKPTKKSALRYAKRIANLTGHPIEVAAINTRLKKCIIVHPNED